MTANTQTPEQGAEPITAQENDPGPNGASADDAMLQRILAERRHPGKLVKTTIGLAEQNKVLRHSLNAVQSKQEELRQELQAVCAPEHYPALVTAVEQNGCWRASLHFKGMTPVRAGVHPDVDPAKLQVGSKVFVNKNRNCVLEVSANAAQWSDLGTFEEYLPDGRLLVKQQEQSFALTPVNELREVQLNKGDRIGFESDARLAFTRVPAPDGQHFFEEAPEDDFADLGGLEEIIREIQDAVAFNLLHPHIAERFQLPRKRGILFVGPPGNGKTRLARCTASYVSTLFGQRCRLQCIVGSEDYSMWLGGTETRLKERFAAARDVAKDGPCIIFIDEIDALLRRRGNDLGGAASERIATTLLGLMDDVHKTLDNVVLIGATNRADMLDPGVTRPGRLDLKLTVARPNRRAAEAILQRYLDRGLPLADESAEGLIAPLLSRIYSPRSEYAGLVRVKLNDGRVINVAAKELISGAMLEHIVRRAAQQAARREILTGRADSVTGEDLTESLDQELTSTAKLLSPANVKAYVQTVPQDAHPVEVTIVRGASAV